MRKRYTLPLLLLFLLQLIAAAPSSAANWYNGVRVVVDGTLQNFPQPAKSTNGVTMVPMRPIFEALGATITWDSATSTVSATRGTTTVSLSVGKSEALKNGQRVALEQAPVIQDGTLLVPLRFVAEAFDARLGWNELSQSAYIWTPERFGSAAYNEPVQGRLAVSDEYALAVRDDGTVWAWGAISDEPGSGVLNQQGTPTPVPGMTGVVSVAARGFTALSVKQDGTVWQWQYGTSSPDNRVPKQVKGITDAVAVAVGGNFRVAVRRDGTVWTWGSGWDQVLGDGTTGYRPDARQVPGLTGVKAVATGFNHTIALKQDGTVWAWGSGDAGALGNGPSSDSKALVQVNITDVVAVAAAQDVSYAIRKDGTLWGWGQNRSWSYPLQPEGPNVISKPEPVQKLYGGLRNVAAVTATDSFTVVLLADGSAWTWGANVYNVLGHPSIPYTDGKPDDPNKPRPLLPGVKVAAVAGGHTAAILLTESGELWGVGDNRLGQLGDGTWRLAEDYTRNLLRLEQYQGAPTMVATQPAAQSTGFLPSGTALVAFDRLIKPGPAFGQIQLRDAAGRPAAALVTPTGYRLQVRSSKALAPSTAYTLQIPVGAVVDLDGHPNDQAYTVNFTTAAADKLITSVSASYNRTWAVYGGSVYVWGTYFGATPVEVGGLQNALAVAGGGDFTPVLGSDGSVWNLEGQTKDSMTARKLTLPAARMVAAGLSHGLAVTRDGSLYAWGANNRGQLGTTEVDDATEPIAVSGMTGVAKVVTKADLSVALKADGSVWYWGVGTARPRQIPGVADAVEVDASADTVYIVRKDGTVWQFANRQLTQFSELSNVASVSDSGVTDMLLLRLQDGTVWTWGSPNPGHHRVLSQVPGLADVTQISAGSMHYVALRSDSTLWAWGRGDSGQVGDGSGMYQRSHPICALFPGIELVEH